MKKALFFDLDGTLWDALPQLLDAWNEAMKKSNLPYRFDFDTMQSYMGLTPEETAPLAFKDVDLAKGMEYFKICLDYELKYLAIHPGKLYENEEEVLQELSNKYSLYVVSNADKGYIENYLYACNMKKYFKGHICAGDTLKDKWENILILKERENIDDLIYIGDTLKDKIQCDLAKVKFIHASYGFGKISEEVAKINNLKELPSKVEELFK